MPCHVFFSEELVFFKLLYTELLFAQRTSSLYYFSSGMHSEYFGIKTTRKFIAHVFPLLKSGDAHQKDVPAEDKVDGWEDVWEETKETVHHQASRNLRTCCQEILTVAATKMTWTRLPMSIN